MGGPGPELARGGSSSCRPAGCGDTVYGQVAARRAATGLAIKGALHPACETQYRLPAIPHRLAVPCSTGPPSVLIPRRNGNALFLAGPGTSAHWQPALLAATAVRGPAVGRRRLPPSPQPRAPPPLTAQARAVPPAQSHAWSASRAPPLPAALAAEATPATPGAQPRLAAGQRLEQGAPHQQGQHQGQQRPIAGPAPAAPWQPWRRPRGRWLRGPLGSARPSATTRSAAWRACPAARWWLDSVTWRHRWVCAVCAVRPRVPVCVCVGKAQGEKGFALCMRMHKQTAGHER